MIEDNSALRLALSREALLVAISCAAMRTVELRKVTACGARRAVGPKRVDGGLTAKVAVPNAIAAAHVVSHAEVIRGGGEARGQARSDEAKLACGWHAMAIRAAPVGVALLLPLEGAGGLSLVSSSPF